MTDPLSLRPVIRPTPHRDEEQRSFQRVMNQKIGARLALYDSAARTGAPLGRLEQDHLDAPLPSNGWFWSISHARDLVSGVVFKRRVGIDVEKVVPRKPHLVPPVASRTELELFGGFSWRAFARVWTAKESVLKKAGVGLGELSRCEVVAVPGDDLLVVRHRDTNHRVHQLYVEGHVVSLSVDASSDFELEWTFDPEPPTMEPRER